MNYSEITTMATLCADYEKYSLEASKSGKKPVSMIKFAFGNM